MKAVLLQLVFVIGFLLVVNVVLHYGQDIWHNNSNQRIEQIESELKKLEQVINTYERINDSGKITGKQYGYYKLKINEYNELVDELNRLYKKTGTRYYVR